MPYGNIKGIGEIYQCKVDNQYEIVDLNSLKMLITTAFEKLGLSGKIDFSENENIGTSHMLYKFNFSIGEKRCASIRAVVREKNLVSIVIVFSEECRLKLPAKKIVLSSFLINEKRSTDKVEVPPGQSVIKDFVIYRILGQPNISSESWRLKIFGEVTKSIELTYEDLAKLNMKSYVADFHCVTGWTVKNVKWEGVPTSEIAKLVGIKGEVEWVMVYSADGYTTIIPIKDFLGEDSMIALRMNNKVLTPEQGFPARLFIPNLYGWKGAKWLVGIEFRKDYSDGYWEALGYHERGNVWLEERFKKF